jgi:ferritin
MIKQPIEDALNDHINLELTSSYLYLSMSAWFGEQELSGAAHWMRLQSQEEHGHALRFFDFLIERNGIVRLQTVAAPQTKWDTPLAVFEHAYRHECEISERIHRLVDLVLEHRDHATHSFLAWFVNEQVEEEATASNIVAKLQLVDNDGRGLLLIDQELGNRVLTPQPGA